jgi:mannose-6-phosphate isomerase-like protein (cupin superfamily)
MNTTKKPWGNFKEFALNKKCTVKILTVNPFGALSLQYHNKRDEMCYFLTPGYVQLRDKKKKVKKGEIIHIKKKQLHRVFAKDKKVEYLEISFGDFDEKDIIRLEDKYGRVKK